MVEVKYAARQASETAARLERLLSGELDFHSASSNYASHALHAFAAKFPPQIPRAFTEALTDPGETVLDPMMGSGTAVVEAAMLGRRAIGVDIDPLAVRICRVKTTAVESADAEVAARSATARAQILLMDREGLRGEMGRRFDSATREFLEYWFLPETRDELTALVLSIAEVSRDDVRELLEFVLSSIIVTKSGGVSRARDLAHSRPHRVADKRPRSAIGEFARRAQKTISALAGVRFDPSAVRIYQGDARELPVGDCCVDLVITSPPYANAIDYVRAHKFSLTWLGLSVAQLSELRATYIGSENCGSMPDETLPQGSESTIARLASRDARKARMLRKYLAEMKQAVREMYRVLRPGGGVGIVVGPSTMRGVKVETHHLLAEIAAALGFEVVGVRERQLDRDRRMMPARRDQSAMNGIERRMHEEFVIGLVRPWEEG